MLTSRKLLTSATTPTEDNTKAAAAAYENQAKPPGTSGELGDAFVAQLANDLIRNLEVVVKAAGFSLLTEDTSDTVTVGSGSNAQTIQRRDAILARAILALASGTAQTSFFGLTDTPASAAAGNDGDAVVLSGSNLVLKTLVNTVRVETRAPRTSDSSSGGNVWVFGGHMFIYREVVGTDHVWDVAGTWATANIAEDGTIRSNGIYAPTGYSGNGWAQFTSIVRRARGVYGYQMRGAGNATNYAVAVTPDYSASTRGIGRPADNRENVGIIEPTANSFSTAFGHENRGTGTDAPHSVVVTRIGSA